MCGRDASIIVSTSSRRFFADPAAAVLFVSDTHDRPLQGVVRDLPRLVALAPVKIALKIRFSKDSSGWKLIFRTF
jgi:hypothetical protein